MDAVRVSSPVGALASVFTPIAYADFTWVLVLQVIDLGSLPTVLTANLQSARRQASATGFIKLLVERGSNMRLSCVLFEHVFTKELVQSGIVGVAVGQAAASTAGGKPPSTTAVQAEVRTVSICVSHRPTRHFPTAAC